MEPSERIARFIVEAVELAQAEGIAAELVHRIAEVVYARPPGKPIQEVGGVSLCLLAYCEARGISADLCEADEIERVLSKDAEHFRERQREKAALGISAP